MKLGAGWVEVALARCQTMGRPYLDNTAQTEVRVVENPPDQVRAVESRGGTGGGGVRGRNWWKGGLGKVKQGQREVGKDESDAFGAGCDDIHTLTTVVVKGGAESKSAIPVRDPSVAVVRVGESKAELARGVNRVGGEVVWEAVEARSGGEGWIGAPRTHDVEGDFGIG